MNLIAAIQLLIALAFVSIPLVRARYGDRAKIAAEAELARQGVSPTVLAEKGLRFDASGHETWAPVGIALVMAALAALNLAGADLAVTLTWILQPVLFLGNLVIMYSNFTAAKSVTKVLPQVDAVALLKAADDAFPRWVTPWLQNLRNVVVLGGSAIVLLALAL
ncbi:MAG: hypothetical protein HOY71_43045 [Nonomuraea sp.]|nr:hypothetical protein [Nonomuraea sp.]